MTKEKNKTELWQFYLNGDLDKLNVEELKELQALIETHGAIKKETKVEIVETVVEPEDKMNLDTAEHKYIGNDDTVKLTSWAKQNSLKDYEDMWINTDSDASCPDDYSDWTPTEFFSSYILSGVATNCELASLCKVKVDVAAGKGTKVVFRTVGVRTATAAAGCECKSCTSTPWGKEEVTIGRFTDHNIICEFDAWAALGTKEAELKEMRKGAERYVDAAIYTAISGATPGFNVDLPTAMQCSAKYPDGSCCSVDSGIHIYTAVIDLLTEMREGNYEPDALLMSPSVAAFFKYKDAIDIPYIMRNAISLDASGRLVELGGVKVVECNRMSSCSNATGQVLVYAIQSDRSIGIAWGRKAKFYEIYRGDCDSWSIGFNAYFGTDSLDDDSIGTVSNP